MNEWTPKLKSKETEIRKLYSNGATLLDLGQKYGVSRETIRTVLGFEFVSEVVKQRAELLAKKKLAARDAIYLKRYGCDLADTKKYSAYKEAYRKHRANSKSRGIDFDMSLPEWASVWIDSGKWGKRGRGRGTYVMARYGDVGPYSVENVLIIPTEYNSRDGIVRAHENQGHKSGIRLFPAKVKS